MATVLVDISLSLDGFVAGPADGLGPGLGVGGEPIHDWVLGAPPRLEQRRVRASPYATHIRYRLSWT